MDQQNNHVLVNQTNNYEGLYVALDTMLNGNVVAEGKSMVKVHEEAKAKGIENPIVVYIPEKDSVFVY